MSRPLLIAACLAALGGCAGEFPRDPERTTTRMRGGVMQVGVSHDPPHVVVHPDGVPTGSDVDTIGAFATRHGARVAWVRGDHDGLMHGLEARRLQAVIGGVHVESPWASRVGMTRPFRAVDAHGRRVRRVIAMPPGENAWLMHMDTLLHETRR